MSEESAALAILDQLERLAPMQADEWLRIWLTETDAEPTSALASTKGRHYPSRETIADQLVAVFPAEIPIEQIDFIALLYNHAHTLIALARLGLSSQGLAPRRKDLCPSCGSDNIGRFRAAAHSRALAKRFWCRDCDLEFLELHGLAPAADHSSRSTL